MSRNKSNTKSSWKRKDKEYRLGQNAKAKRNRQRHEAHVHAAAHGVTFEEALDAITGPAA